MRRRFLPLQLLLWGICWSFASVAHGSDGVGSETDLSQLNLVHWTTEDGLPSSSLTDVLQTRDGYIWIASFNGLIRFDGVSFTTFNERSQPALPTSGVRVLAEDAGGTLWIGTQGHGVLTYRRGRFETFHAEYGRRSTVLSLLLDEGGETWVGVTDFGVYRHQGEEVSRLEHPALLDSSVRDILRDHTGATWLAAEGQGLVRYDEGSFTTYTVESGLDSAALTSLYESAQGEIYVGSWGGLNKVVDGKVLTVSALSGVEVYRICGDGAGNLWLATEQGLYRRSAEGELERFSKLRGVELGGISALAFDHEGSLWLVSTVNGLFQLKVSRFHNYSIEQGLSTRRMNFVRELGEKEYWAGADDGTVNVIRDGEVSTLTFDSLPPDLRIRDVHRTGDGSYWITSYAGLLHVVGDKEVLYTTEDGLPTNQLRSLFEDRRGTLWIATQNGGLVSMSEAGSFETLDISSGLTSSFVFSIDEDLEGRLVIGARGALTLRDGEGRFTHYTAEDALPGSIVFSTSTDRDGSLWICTNEGLARLAGGEIKTVTAGDGLPTDAFFDFAEDAQGFVWLSSSRGVVRVRKAVLIDFLEGRAWRVEATLFDESDGMTSRDCTGAAHFLQASDGKLWFPTLGGISVVDPGNLPKNEVAPRVAINRFEVDGEAVDFYQDLEIKPGRKRFTFEIAALSFLAPESVRVRYRLDGFDEDWNDLDVGRRVDFTNLSPGEHAFRVIAANDDGVWSYEGKTVRFWLQPFFYQRLIFYAALVVLLVFVLRGLHLWRLRTVRERNLELEKIVAELERSQKDRQRLIGELRASAAEMERFVYTVSHDLKSPLVTIKGFLSFLRKDMEVGNFESANRDADQIDNAAERMRRLVVELLELSRVGRVVNDPTQASMSELAEEAAEVVSGRTAERGVRLVIDPDMGMVTVDRHRLVQVFQNLIENAVKYLGDQDDPRVDVGCRRNTDGTAFFVRDNGQGIDSTDLEKVFDMFERLHGGEGTGIGLAIVKRVVEAHGGRIWAESEGRGHGATFYFTLST